MTKKVLGILGSPRRNGKVATLSPYQTCCRACLVCRSQGHCVLDDNLHTLAGEITTADVVVLAAPTYWANVPGIVKRPGRKSWVIGII